MFNKLINTNAGGGVGGWFLAAGLAESFYSADGINWTKITDPKITDLDYSYAAEAHNGNYYLSGLKSNGNNGFFYSTDCINWVEQTNPQVHPDGDAIRGIFNTGTRLYCSGIRTYYTTDLTGSSGWIETNNSSFNTIGINIIYTGQNYVMTGRGTPVIKYSTDGITWVNSSPTAIAFNSIGVSANGSGTVVAAGYDVSRVASSTNHGVSWTNRVSSGTVGYLSYYDGNKFHVDIQGGSYYQSTSGTGGYVAQTKLMSQNINDMAYNGSILVAAGRGTVVLAYSTDLGANWNTISMPGIDRFYNIACDGDPNILRP